MHRKKFIFNYDKEFLKRKVIELLKDVGIKVENDKLEESLLKKGCNLRPNGRVSIPETLINDYVSYQNSKENKDSENELLYSYYGVDFTNWLTWSGRRKEALEKINNELMVALFDCGPMKYYDYLSGKTIPNTTDIFINMMKFAQSTKEVGYISGWYRTDVSPKIERIDSLILGLNYTDKYDGVEAIYPEVIKYLCEISEIVSGIPGDTRYLAGSECFTPPLILEKRSAADILERIKRKVKRYHIASMPTIGVSTPLSIGDSAIIGAAEILGGLAIVNCLDPESDLSGRMICDMIDMKTANTSCTFPDCTVVNLCVKDLFETYWGGNLWVETFMGPTAKKPGMMAVYENMFAAYSRIYISCVSDKPYPIFGVLDKGGIGSPTQAMLDIEIRKAQYYLKNKVKIDDYMSWDELKETISNGGNFLSSGYTLEHFKDKFESKIFLTSEPLIDGWDGTEKSILDICDNLWRENIKNNYKEPELIDKEKKKELNKLLKLAKKELL